MKLVGRRKIEDQKVYDIGLEGPHNFLLSNGTVPSNCFNKAHSLAYAYIGYQEAYLKAHYPAEFFAALLTHTDKDDKVSRYIAEAKSMGVGVHGPSVNSSQRGFGARDGKIYYGIRAIKGLGAAAANSVIKSRDTKSFGTRPYKDIWDFCSRVSRQIVNKGSLEVLTEAGAFDCMGYDRQELLDALPTITKYYQDLVKYNEKCVKCNEREKLVARLEQDPELLEEMKEEAKLDGKRFIKPRLLKRPEKPVKPELNTYPKLRITPKMLVMESAVLGTTITAHPTDFITMSAQMCRVSDLHRGGQRAKLAVMVVSTKTIKTKKGQLMAFSVMEDNTGRLEATVFPRTYAKYHHLLENGKIVLLDCKVDDRPGEASKIPVPVIVDGLKPLER